MTAKTMPSKFNSTDKFSGKQIAEGSTIVEFAVNYWVAATPFTLALAGREEELIATLGQMAANGELDNLLTRALVGKTISRPQWMGIINMALTSYLNTEAITYTTPAIWSALGRMGVDIAPDFVIIKPQSSAMQSRMYLDANGRPAVGETLAQWTGQEPIDPATIPAHVAPAQFVAAEVAPVVEGIAPVVAIVEEVAPAKLPEVNVGGRYDSATMEQLASQFGDSVWVDIANNQTHGQADADYGAPVGVIIHTEPSLRKRIYNVYKKS